MSQLRLLGGKAKGVGLLLPPSFLARPTSSRLKRRLFDAFQDWRGVTFLDLYAGSGAMGLEALSRGARKAIFVEKNREVFRLLKENISKVQKAIGESCGEVELHHQEALSVLNMLDSRTPSETVVFADPPYDAVSEYVSLTQFFLAPGRWNEVWIELDTNRQPQILEQLSVADKIWYKLYKQGEKVFIRIRPLPQT